MKEGDRNKRQKRYNKEREQGKRNGRTEREGKTEKWHEDMRIKAKDESLNSSSMEVT